MEKLIAARLNALRKDAFVLNMTESDRRETESYFLDYFCSGCDEEEPGKCTNKIHGFKIIMNNVNVKNRHR